MKNINDVRKELSQLFSDLKNDIIDYKKAKELNNCAGKIINSLKVELEYHALRREKPLMRYLSNK